MAAKKYEAWKKGLWEAYRTFIPAFLVVIFAQFEAGVNLQEWRAWLPPLVLSGGAAGTRAVVKWYREVYAPKQYDSLVYKLPA